MDRIYAAIFALRTYLAARKLRNESDDTLKFILRTGSDLAEEYDRRYGEFDVIPSHQDMAFAPSSLYDAKAAGRILTERYGKDFVTKLLAWYQKDN